MEDAFDIPQSRIFNAPGWTSSQPFDIEAKSDDALERRLHDLPPDQARPIKLAMIQALLVNRFGLKTHREQRELPIYELVVLPRADRSFRPASSTAFSSTTTSVPSTRRA